MNPPTKSAATDLYKPLPLWLTSPRSRPALHVPILTRLLRALGGSGKRPAARPNPWHHDLPDNSQGIELSGEDGNKPKNG
jgi:hypothetical protein